MKIRSFNTSKPIDFTAHERVCKVNTCGLFTWCTPGSKIAFKAWCAITLLSLARLGQAFPQWPLWLDAPHGRDNSNDPRSDQFRPTPFRFPTEEIPATDTISPSPTLTLTENPATSWSPSTTVSPTLTPSAAQTATWSATPFSAS